MRTTVKTGGRSMAWYASMSLLMFGFIFEFYLYAFGIPNFVTPSRIAAITITILAILKIAKSKRNKKPFEGIPGKALRKFCWFHVPVILYMLLLYVTIGVQGDSRHMFTILIHTFVFRIIPIWAFYVYLDSLEELMNILVITMLIQTGFIWLCITNPTAKLIIDNTFHLSETYIYYRDTYAGGLGCITSQGLIRYAVGEVACVYLYYKKNNILYIALLLLFGLTGSMIARTGLVVVAICASFVLYYAFKRHRTNVLRTLLFSIILTLLSAYVILSSNSSRNFLESRFTRMSELFEQTEDATDIYDVGFFDSYMHGTATILPPITTETIVGTGVPSGTSGNGVTVNIDGGFFRLYVAYGLILAIIFYAFFLHLIFRVSFSFKNIDIRYTMLLMSALIIVGEFKEWSIYASCHVTIFFLMALLAYQDLKKVKRLELVNGNIV